MKEWNVHVVALLVVVFFGAFCASVSAEGSGGQDSEVMELDAIVVTPARYAEYPYNLNSNVSVITAQEIEDSGARSVQEAIKCEPGIIIGGFADNPKNSAIDIRGYGDSGMVNYLVLIDGRRINQIDLSGADMSQIDVNSIDRIEIVRGARNVLYGDNATGGVINIITKKGGKGHHVSFSQQIGSYQARKEYVSAYGGEDILDYFVSYSDDFTEGYRSNNRYEADDAMGNFTFTPGDDIEAYFAFSYHRDWYGQPGALYNTNIENNGRRISRFPDSKADTEDYFITFDPRKRYEIDGGEVSISSPLTYRSRKARSRSVSTKVYTSRHFIDSFDWSPKVEWETILMGGLGKNKLIVGVDYFHALDSFGSGDVTLTESKADITKDMFGVYLSDNLILEERFIVSGGVRTEWTKYIFDQGQPVPSKDMKSPIGLAFDGGLGYKYNDSSRVYFNYARSYRNPATDEFFQSAYEFDAVKVPASLNTSLKQQVGNNYEIGISDRTFEPFELSADYYIIDNKNEIYYDPDDYLNRNYHHTVHHGLELSAGTVISDRVEIGLGYTLQRSYFDGGKFDNKNIPLVPENKLSARIGLKRWKGLAADLIMNFVGARYAANDQSNSAPELKQYLTLDANVSYEWKAIRIFFSAKNILNERYNSSGTKGLLGSIAVYPAPESNFEFGVSLEF